MKPYRGRQLKALEIFIEGEARALVA
jgi:hypothetical protein